VEWKRGGYQLTPPFSSQTILYVTGLRSPPLSSFHRRLRLLGSSYRGCSYVDFSLSSPLSHSQRKRTEQQRSDILTDPRKQALAPLVFRAIRRRVVVMRRGSLVIIMVSRRRRWGMGQRRAVQWELTPCPLSSPLCSLSRNNTIVTPIACLLSLLPSPIPQPLNALDRHSPLLRLLGLDALELLAILELAGGRGDVAVNEMSAAGMELLRDGAALRSEIEKRGSASERREASQRASEGQTDVDDEPPQMYGLDTVERRHMNYQLLGACEE